MEHLLIDRLHSHNVVGYRLLAKLMQAATILQHESCTSVDVHILYLRGFPGLDL